MTLFTCTIYKSFDKTAGLSQDDRNNHALAQIEFEAPGQKNMATKATSVNVRETSFSLDYNEFKLKASDVWTKVVYLELSDRYELYLNSVDQSKLFTENFSSIANGQIIDVTKTSLKSFSLQVDTIGGSVTMWDVRLGISLDGINVTDAIQHTNLIGSGQIVFASVITPARFVVIRCIGLTLGTGTGITAKVFGME